MKTCLPLLRSNGGDRVGGEDDDSAAGERRGSVADVDVRAGAWKGVVDAGLEGGDKRSPLPSW